MRPVRGYPTRRGQRAAWKGTPTGRRTTHPVRITWGQQHRLRAENEYFTALCERIRTGHSAAATQGGSMPVTEICPDGDLDGFEEVASHVSDIGDWCPRSGERTADGTCPVFCHAADIAAGFDAGDRILKCQFCEEDIMRNGITGEYDNNQGEPRPCPDTGDGLHLPHGE